MTSDKTQEIEGFRCVPTKLTSTCTAGHILYIKQHAVRNSTTTKPVGRTLFVLNVPPYYTEDNFRNVFGTFGTVENVFFQQKPSSGDVPKSNSKFFPNKDAIIEGFRVAYIVFEDAKTLKKVLSGKLDSPLIFSADNKAVLTGMKKWVKNYESTFLNARDLEREVNNFMAKHDAKREEEEKMLKEKEGVPDEDGWVTVTKKGRNPGFTRTDAKDENLQKKAKKKRSQKNLVSFYAFQQRETKMEKLAELRKKFEEDKKRISAMKAARKFRPY